MGGGRDGGRQCALQHHSRQCGEEPSRVERTSDSVCGVHTTAEPEQRARTERRVQGSIPHRRRSEKTETFSPSRFIILF